MYRERKIKRVGEGRHTPDKEDWSRKRRGTKGRNHGDPNLLPTHSGRPELKALVNAHSHGERWTLSCRSEPLIFSK